ncbi:hypothetical protein ACFVVX_20240 [Kitasatospora sp. NPDC058170]|uniref:hypothetical protein n=1 Tax=Kitasatospora sp. NPDC058170 TaxID=3346364 RepID=UPI0036DC1D63
MTTENTMTAPARTVPSTVTPAHATGSRTRGSAGAVKVVPLWAAPWSLTAQTSPTR